MSQLFKELVLSNLYHIHISKDSRMQLPIIAQYVFNLRLFEDSLKSQLWNFISLQKQHKFQDIFLASKVNVIIY